MLAENKNAFVADVHTKIFKTGVGWFDWGNSGLNPLEQKINGLVTGHRG